ncbi:PepSY-like domain-containing protein [Mesonia maritima]|uniref:Putative beta-lactamase-inhibitor-like PepSY-like domain-containing protein n=1 Tax=Mesonia maritima TaxID=1793873 RepID=A0ABU1K4E6_9FLAO|nr:PepSY-like domain-containing protein [Mesonia maritima]MDR6300459.1 hypothetical protein [Mesonia maritima]
MKLFYFLSIYLLLIACKEEDDHSFTTVPSVVASTFQSNFQNTIGLEWEVVGKNFEAEFELASIEYKALFNKKGELLKYKKDCSYSQLPQNLKQILNENFELNQLDEIEQIHIRGRNYYQLEIEQSFTELKKLFNANGNLINTIPIWD